MDMGGNRRELIAGRLRVESRRDDTEHRKRLDAPLIDDCGDRALDLLGVQGRFRAQPADFDEHRNDGVMRLDAIGAHAVTESAPGPTLADRRGAIPAKNEVRPVP